MRRLILFVYVISVLLIAGFAEARTPSISYASESTSQFYVHSYDYDQRFWMVLLQGHMSTPCIRSPRPVLEQDPQIESVYWLDVKAQSTADICVQTLSESFELAFDLRSLIQESNIDPQFNSVEIRIANTDFALEVSPQEAHSAFPVASRSVVGQVLPTSDPAVFYLMSSQGEPILLQAPMIDFSKYVEKTVEVIGHEIPQHMPMNFASSSMSSSNPNSSWDQTLVVSGVSPFFPAE